MSQVNSRTERILRDLRNYSHFNESNYLRKIVERNKKERLQMLFFGSIPSIYEKIVSFLGCYKSDMFKQRNWHYHENDHILSPSIFIYLTFVHSLIPR
jgi:hypothetical protein